MDRETLRDLRLDRRLIRRRGWIASDELTQELEALPDASDKIARDEEAVEASGPPADD